MNKKGLIFVTPWFWDVPTRPTKDIELNKIDWWSIDFNFINTNERFKDKRFYRTAKVEFKKVNVLILN